MSAVTPSPRSSRQLTPRRICASPAQQGGNLAFDIIDRVLTKRKQSGQKRKCHKVSNSNRTDWADPESYADVLFGLLALQVISDGSGAETGRRCRTN